MIIHNNKRIFAFADTHGNHLKLQVPEDTDIVICAGDAVEDNLKGGEYDDFIDWFAELPAKWKLFFLGTMSFRLSLINQEKLKKPWKQKRFSCCKTP